MKVDESSSGSSSAATSTSAPKKPGDGERPSNPSPAAKPPKEASEQEFLARQAEHAHLAMAQAWADLKHSLASGVDVRNWTKQYPWIATSTALAAGVAAGYFLTPRDKDEFREMWEKLKDRLSGARADPNAVYVEPVRGGAAPPPQQPSLLGSILREAVKSAMPLVTSMLGAAVGGSGQAGPHNGHDETTATDTGNPPSA